MHLERLRDHRHLPTMYQSPRMRRLRNDLTALDRLRSESSVFRFSTQGDPPHHYRIVLKGRGLWRDRGKIKTLETHRVEIKLGSSYPRTMPEIRWVTPIYHPNISEIGMVCLGGYGTHWVPSVQLDELCTMLWDMVRYHNYDIRSPYNREAALWVANQTTFRFPTDDRPLRDLRAAQGRVAPTPSEDAHVTTTPAGTNGTAKPSTSHNQLTDPSQVARVRQFVNALDLRRRQQVDFHPQVNRLRQAVERYRWFFGYGPASEPNVPSSDGGMVMPGPAVQMPVMTSTDPSAVSQADPEGGVVLLEPVVTVEPGQDQTSPDADGIVFIE
jgi:ubiquitin-protein ligase